MIDISHSLEIPGFMAPNELEWLAEKAQGRKFVAEVGCWMGRSSKALAEHCDGRVLCVDTWKGCAELDHLTPDGAPDNWMYTNWLYYTQGSKNVIACHMPSLHAAERLLRYGMWIGDEFIKMPAFDMVFIDGLHDYENVKADILAWMPCVVDGGILCGHDFHHPPVRQAYRELFGAEHETLHPDTRMWEVEVHWQ